MSLSARSTSMASGAAAPPPPSLLLEIQRHPRQHQQHFSNHQLFVPPNPNPALQLQQQRRRQQTQRSKNANKSLSTGMSGALLVGAAAISPRTKPSSPETVPPASEIVTHSPNEGASNNSTAVNSISNEEIPQSSTSNNNDTSAQDRMGSSSSNEEQPRPQQSQQEKPFVPRPPAAPRVPSRTSSVPPRATTSRAGSQAPTPLSSTTSTTTAAGSIFRRPPPTIEVPTTEYNAHLEGSVTGWSHNDNNNNDNEQQQPEQQQNNPSPSQNSSPKKKKPSYRLERTDSSSNYILYDRQGVPTTTPPAPDSVVPGKVFVPAWRKLDLERIQQQQQQQIDDEAAGISGDCSSAQSQHRLVQTPTTYRIDSLIQIPEDKSLLTRNRQQDFIYNRIAQLRKRKMLSVRKDHTGKRPQSSGATGSRSSHNITATKPAGIKVPNGSQLAINSMFGHFKQSVALYPHRIWAEMELRNDRKLAQRPASSSSAHHPIATARRASLDREIIASLCQRSPSPPRSTTSARSARASSTIPASFTSYHIIHNKAPEMERASTTVVKAPEDFPPRSKTSHGRDRARSLPLHSPSNDRRCSSLMSSLDTGNPSTAATATITTTTTTNENKGDCSPIQHVDQHDQDEPVKALLQYGSDHDDSDVQHFGNLLLGPYADAVSVETSSCGNNANNKKNNNNNNNNSNSNKPKDEKEQRKKKQKGKKNQQQLCRNSSISISAWEEESFPLAPTSSLVTSSPHDGISMYIRKKKHLHNLIDVDAMSNSTDRTDSPTPPPSVTPKKKSQKKKSRPSTASSTSSVVKTRLMQAIEASSRLSIAAPDGGCSDGGAPERSLAGDNGSEIDSQSENTIEAEIAVHGPTLPKSGSERTLVRSKSPSVCSKMPRRARSALARPTPPHGRKDYNGTTSTTTTTTATATTMSRPLSSRRPATNNNIKNKVTTMQPPTKRPLSGASASHNRRGSHSTTTNNNSNDNGSNTARTSARSGSIKEFMYEKDHGQLGISSSSSPPPPTGIVATTSTSAPTSPTASSPRLFNAAAAAHQNRLSPRNASAATTTTNFTLAAAMISVSSPFICSSSPPPRSPRSPQIFITGTAFSNNTPRVVTINDRSNEPSPMPPTDHDPNHNHNHNQHQHQQAPMSPTTIMSGRFITFNELLRKRNPLVRDNSSGSGSGNIHINSGAEEIAISVSLSPNNNKSANTATTTTTTRSWQHHPSLVIAAAATTTPRSRE